MVIKRISLSEFGILKSVGIVFFYAWLEENGINIGNLHTIAVWEALYEEYQN